MPSLSASPDWDLVATCSRAGSVPGVAGFTDMDQMLASCPEISVVSLCLPPRPRFDYARKALLAGRHVMLEKPPGATLSECHALEAMARERGLVLFASWHSREAACVASARDWLSDKRVTGARIIWKEDVRKWHPGQDWVFEPAGMGVFDPGINALSILTEILPLPVHLTAARLEVPENRQGPIGAELTFTDGVSAVFDWRQEGPQTWDIEVLTEAGPTLLLQEGGAKMVLDGTVRDSGGDTLRGEYPRLYRRMADLVANGQSDVDLSPLRHVADAFMLGERVTVAPFHWTPT